MFPGLLEGVAWWEILQKTVGFIKSLSLFPFPVLIKTKHCFTDTQDDKCPVSQLAVTLAQSKS